MGEAGERGGGGAFQDKGDASRKGFGIVDHAVADPFKGDARKGMRIEVRDERAVALGDACASRIVVNHARDEPARGGKKEPLHAIAADVAVDGHDELLVLKELVQYVEIALLPSGHRLAPGDCALGIFLKRPFHQVVDVLEVVVERHAADAAILRDVSDGDFRKRFGGQLPFE